jgi:hypothetical protein
MEVGVVVPGVAAKDLEGVVNGDVALGGDDAFGLLDHDPALERPFELRDRGA